MLNLSPFYYLKTCWGITYKYFLIVISVFIAFIQVIRGDNFKEPELWLQTDIEKEKSFGLSQYTFLIEETSI